jgi:hypothetical protein
VAIKRRPARPKTIVVLPTRHTLYSVRLTAAPSRAWRAAFLRSPPALPRGRFTPELGRVNLDGATASERLHRHRGGHGPACMNPGRRGSAPTDPSSGAGGARLVCDELHVVRPCRSDHERPVQRAVGRGEPDLVAPSSEFSDEDGQLSAFRTQAGETSLH